MGRLYESLQLLDLLADEELIALLEELEARVPRRNKATKIIFYPGGPLVSLQLTDIQKVDLAVGYQDAAGNPTAAPAGATLTAVSSDPTVLGVTLSADSTTITVEALGPLGTAQVQVSDGTAQGVLDVEVIASDATTINLTPGTPTNK